MRSKSVAERPKSDDKACAPTARALHTLSLVRDAETRPAGAMKPGLY